jgi:hypothetical protein
MVINAFDDYHPATRPLPPLPCFNLLSREYPSAYDCFSVLLLDAEPIIKPNKTIHRMLARFSVDFFFHYSVFLVSCARIRRASVITVIPAT